MEVVVLLTKVSWNDVVVVLLALWWQRNTTPTDVWAVVFLLWHALVSCPCPCPCPTMMRSFHWVWQKERRVVVVLQVLQQFPTERDLILNWRSSTCASNEKPFPPTKKRWMVWATTSHWPFLCVLVNIFWCPGAIVSFSIARMEWVPTQWCLGAHRSTLNEVFCSFQSHWTAMKRYWLRWDPSEPPWGERHLWRIEFASDRFWWGERWTVATRTAILNGVDADPSLRRTPWNHPCPFRAVTSAAACVISAFRGQCCHPAKSWESEQLKDLTTYTELELPHRIPRKNTTNRSFSIHRDNEPHHRGAQIFAKTHPRRSRQQKMLRLQYT